MSEPLVKLTINGQPIEAPAGINLIEAAKLIGVEIPHFCYHPDLCIVGNCRMCVVEVATLRTGPTGTPVLEWNPKLTIACNTTVVEGMEVLTHTPRIIEARRGVMEFLLINHPLDCPICDQAGECRLQELAVDYGRAESRFVEEKERKPKRTLLGPKIMLDDERCILCSRCIRFMRDVAGQDCLGFTGRGSRSTLTCYPGREPSTNYDLNIVDLCPVGALTSVDFRFKQRVWFLKQTRSLCPHCSTGCNIVIGSRENTVCRLTPRDNEAVNQRWMCDEGRLNYRFINDPTRLVEPLSRMNGNVQSLSWDEATRQIAERLTALRDGGEGRIAFIGSAGATTEELFLFRQLAGVLGVTLMDVVPHTGSADAWLLQSDRNPNTAGALVTGVAAVPPGSRLLEIAQGIQEGRIRALVVLNEDITPAGIGADLLNKLECLISVSHLPNSVTEAAHYLLPGATFAEKSGTFVNRAGRIQRMNPTVESPGNARPEWRILAGLLAELGQPQEESLESIYRAMAQVLAPVWGVTWDAIGSQGVQLHVD
ncbi:MAG: molybdopterin-dependent oxidoreductase [bacterium]